MAKAIVTDATTCDLCKRKLTHGKTFSDASCPLYGGTWGWLCESCANDQGVSYGEGLGQKYDSQTLEKILG